LASILASIIDLIKAQFRLPEVALALLSETEF